MLDHVGHVGVGSVNTRGAEPFIQDPSCGTHERRTLQVLIISRLLSNEDHARRARSHAEDGLSCILV